MNSDIVTYYIQLIIIIMINYTNSNNSDRPSCLATVFVIGELYLNAPTVIRIFINKFCGLSGKDIQKIQHESIPLKTHNQSLFPTVCLQTFESLDYIPLCLLYRKWPTRLCVFLVSLQNARVIIVSWTRRGRVFLFRCASEGNLLEISTFEGASGYVCVWVCDKTWTCGSGRRRMQGWKPTWSAGALHHLVIRFGCCSCQWGDDWGL